MRVFASSVVLACGLWASTAAASDYDAMYVFGDSLSDRGNLAEAFGARWIDPPSYHYSFTNGPVAVSVLASALGLPDEPSLWVNNFQDDAGLFPPGYVPGTNYAVADATAQLTTGHIDGINLPDQIDAYLTHSNHSADASALYTILIGGNDIANATRAGNADTALPDAITSELAAINSLAGAGARNFLIANVPDVGVTPAFASDPDLAAKATANAELFDTMLSKALSGIDTTAGVTLHQFDFLSYERMILANAAEYGITDVTDYCYDIALPPTDSSGIKTTAACGPNAENIGKLAYWNNFHPTAKVHALIGQGLLESLRASSAVPEPATWIMCIAGLGVVGATMRSRRSSVAMATAARA